MAWLCLGQGGNLGCRREGVVALKHRAWLRERRVVGSVGSSREVVVALRAGRVGGRVPVCVRDGLQGQLRRACLG